MAKWRIERKISNHHAHWWLMSGTHTLGTIHGERTAQQIVKQHNAAENIVETREQFTDRVKDALMQHWLNCRSIGPDCINGVVDATLRGEVWDGISVSHS